MQTDAELLVAWQAGDRDAGGALIDRYFEPLRRFFQNKIATGVEDLIQQTFLVCVQQRDRIRDPEAFRGYLFAAARSKLYDQIGKRLRSPVAPDFMVSSVVDLGVSPSEVIAEHEDQRLLIRALRTLPLELQIALELYYVERVRGRDLEVALELPAGTVRSRLRRAIEQLRRSLAELSSSPEALRETTDNIDRWAAELASGE
ncbi:MAG: sigma-70 family RNA polymerase sigma factor [Deltaproteobacteria bacterium]|nr:sigma-70 family RNA polymerase sigma factor [Deltaproteobacteria bacterium]MBK8241180.1 sigma-70 family RNA polymerase sigma factor [Deltaproteobacteria bacterium]MBK8716899.1 sigma-70 family RNA polymerase sigma factor [Deltaproteobacteria bacterium]MBP7287002.1 sigma-70 family RNA polymerase sigma factor [Nannocystaceae bacterium]